MQLGSLFLIVCFIVSGVVLWIVWLVLAEVWRRLFGKCNVANCDRDSSGAWGPCLKHRCTDPWCVLPTTRLDSMCNRECSRQGCDAHPYGETERCEDHTCLFVGVRYRCINSVARTEKVCSKHMCAVRSCGEMRRYNSKTCHAHRKCAIYGCKKCVEQGLDVCSYHWDLEEHQL